MFDFWPVYSGERFRASGPSCLFQAGDSALQVESHTRGVIIDQSDMYTNVFSDLEDNNVSFII